MTWLKKLGFTNCVFEKLCLSEHTIFIVFAAKHSFSNNKTVCWKKQKCIKNNGLFFEHGKIVFFGPLHLALNPPYFLFFSFLIFFFFGGGCVLFVGAFGFWGGFKGQVRWPKGPPHLALNPPYFVFVFLVFVSLFSLRSFLCF